MPDNHQHHDHKHGHHHGYPHAHHHETDNIKIAILLNVSFTILEFIGGFFSNSVAIMSDAVHDLGDSIVLIFSFFSERVAEKSKSNSKYTFGYQRLPLISAFVNATVLIVGSGFILLHAIERLQNPEPVNIKIMLPIAVVGVLVNGAAVFRLKKNKGVNSKVMYLHLLEDALGWIAVLIGGIVMHFTNLLIIDPIMSIAIAGYILFNAAKNARYVYEIVMQRSPTDINPDKIIDTISSFDEVLGISDFHFWSLEGSKHVMTLHILVNELSKNEIILLKKKVKEEVKSYGTIHLTLELDFEDEVNEDHCISNER